jgi:hypothetical protein
LDIPEHLPGSKFSNPVKRGPSIHAGSLQPIPHHHVRCHNDHSDHVPVEFCEFRTGSVSRIHSAGKASSDQVRIRREHLLQIRNNSHLIDQEVRAREVIEIDRRLAEIESETVDELGNELFLERLESRQNLPADNPSP